MDMKQPVKNFMEPCPVTISEDMSIKDFVQTMVKKNIDFVPVVDGNGSLVGVAYEKSLRKLLKVGTRLSSVFIEPFREEYGSQPVATIMNSRPVTAKSEEPIGNIIQMIATFNLRIVLVLDDGKKPIGYIKMKDLFSKMLE